jgi:hypothetical protein
VHLKRRDQNKALRKPDRGDVVEALLRWLKQEGSDNVPVSGLLLMIKAEEFAKKLRGEEFVCSAGWIDKFRLRHNISFGKESGEASGINSDTTTEWLTAAWLNVREGFAYNYNFDTDETGIFFRLTPDRKLKFKGEKLVASFPKIALQFLFVLIRTGLRRGNCLCLGSQRTSDVLNM